MVPHRRLCWLETGWTKVVVLKKKKKKKKQKNVTKLRPGHGIYMYITVGVSNCVRKFVTCSLLQCLYIHPSYRLIFDTVSLSLRGTTNQCIYRCEHLLYQKHYMFRPPVVAIFRKCSCTMWYTEGQTVYSCAMSIVLPGCAHRQPYGCAMCNCQCVQCSRVAHRCVQCCCTETVDVCHWVLQWGGRVAAIPVGPTTFCCS